MFVSFSLVLSWVEFHLVVYSDLAFTVGTVLASLHGVILILFRFISLLKYISFHVGRSDSHLLDF